MVQKKVGLTLGKYAPLHKGHQLVIETALNEMDEVIVVIYDAPEATPVPLSVRAKWIKTLYPKLKVIEALDGPTEVGDSAGIKKKHEDYIIKNLGISKVSAFYSSEFYGDHMSKALKAQNRLIDPKRKTVPISATEIRSNPYKYRKYLDPLVYRDLITNIVFLGAPSTGKTTMACRMAKEFKTAWMPEFGREYWEKYQVNRRLTQKQLVEIAEKHLEIEDQKILESDRYLFTDTNAVTTYMFSIYYHGKALPELTEYANNSVYRYDIVFLCDTDIPYDDTWDRSGDINRKEFQKQIIADLKKRKIKYHLLKGDLNERVRIVKKVLSKYKKYSQQQSKCKY
jgi:HTH-type transcriptional repressor of NAD biosynthesis genes